jgi:serine/threonine protein phosphatase PrpC
VADKGWKVITKSVIGQSHLRKGLPNQDAIGFYDLPGNSPAKVLAVSDGHGSEKCPRSDTGAAFAVNSAVGVFIDFWNTFHGKLQNQNGADSYSTLGSIERHIRKDVPKQIVKRWVDAVESHAASTPFGREYSTDEELLAYGSTLTVVFVCEYFWTCLQLGDCEALIVDHCHKVNRVARKPHQLIGDETDSLCQRDSDRRFDVNFYGMTNETAVRPKLFLICSDGYEKSFASDDDFEKAALDYLQLLQSPTGKTSIEESLETWLQESSKFSGDDVSLGLLFDLSTAISHTQSEQDSEPLPPTPSVD